MLKVNTGIPIKLFMFKGQNDRHVIKMALEISKTDNSTSGTFKDDIIIRGMSVIDKKGNNNIFFFNPSEDGHRQGYLQGKVESLINPTITESELEEAFKANIISEEQLNELKENKNVTRVDDSVLQFCE